MIRLAAVQGLLCWVPSVVIVVTYSCHLAAVKQLRLSKNQSSKAPVQSTSPVLANRIHHQSTLQTHRSFADFLFHTRCLRHAFAKSQLSHVDRTSVHSHYDLWQSPSSRGCREIAGTSSCALVARPPCAANGLAMSKPSLSRPDGSADKFGEEATR